MTEVLVLIACYNGRNLIADCLRSIRESPDPDLQLRIVVADNASTDQSAELISRDFPDVHLIELKKNCGFTGGINAAWKFARAAYPDARYVAILNQDVFATPGWARSLVAHMDQHPGTAAAQPKILLHPQNDRFNTAGNDSHYLGFGLVTAYGECDDGTRDFPRPIAFPSGAAAMIRASVIEDDLLDELFFLYLEDAELGWRLRQLAHRIDYVPASVVRHQYAFREDYRFYYYLERNRWYLLAMYYRLPTLILLLPAILAMEAGQFYFAWRNRVLAQKFRACGFFLSLSNLRGMLRRRRQIQRRRRISDRRFTRIFVGDIQLPELRSRILRNVGNPLLRTYWRLARPLIFW